MKENFFIFLSLGLLVLSPASGWGITESLSSNLKLRIYQNQVTGNEALSFKTEGLNYLSNVNFNYNRTWGTSENAIDVRGFANLRATDDPQFQVRDDTLRLQNAYVSLIQKNSWEVTGGYFSERFTPYTMSTSLLGVNGQIHLTNSLTWKLFAGRDRRARPGQQYGRYSTGSRLQWSLLKNHTLGMSYVQTKDVLSTLSMAEAEGVSDTRSNEVWSVDYDGQIPSLNSNLAAEIAQSSSDSAPRSTAGERLSKNAYKLSGRTRTDRFGNFRLIYERVQPGFQTLTGFTTPDRSRWNLNWSRRIGRAWSVTSDVEQWHDGLEGARLHDVTDWRLGTSYDPTMTGYWTYSSRASFQNRQDDGRTAPNDPNETDEYLLTLITQQNLGKNTIDAEFVHEDQQSDSETRNRFEVGFTVPFKLTGRNWQYETGGYYETEHNNLGSATEIDRRFRFRNTIIIGHNELETLELSQSYSEEDVANSQEIIRETLRLSYHYTINPTYGEKLSFSYYLNNNDNKGDPTQDYQEETLEMTLNVSF